MAFCLYFHAYRRSVKNWCSGWWHAYNTFSLDNHIFWGRVLWHTRLGFSWHGNFMYSHRCSYIKYKWGKCSISIHFSLHKYTYKINFHRNIIFQRLCLVTALPFLHRINIEWVECFPNIVCVSGADVFFSFLSQIHFYFLFWFWPIFSYEFCEIELSDTDESKSTNLQPNQIEYTFHFVGNVNEQRGKCMFLLNRQKKRSEKKNTKKRQPDSLDVDSTIQFV